MSVSLRQTVFFFGTLLKLLFYPMGKKNHCPTRFYCQSIDLEKLITPIKGWLPSAGLHNTFNAIKYIFSSGEHLATCQEALTYIQQNMSNLSLNDDDLKLFYCCLFNSSTLLVDSNNNCGVGGFLGKEVCPLRPPQLCADEGQPIG